MKGKLLGGRYQVIEILANGGFGQTYVAQDTHRPGNPQCVIKHLKPVSSNSSFLRNARRLFQTEAETLEKLGNHNQIPRLLAFFEENQEFYLVQEFIQGHPLIAELQPEKPWDESKVCQLLQEVLDILDFVHSQGVIHRDIKPENLIRRQQDNKLVLVDFGSVKQIRNQLLLTAQGQAGLTIVVGTPGYMPTEQGQGKPRPNSDIYALGIIAIQALTGLNPIQFQEDLETGEIIWQHQAPQVSMPIASIITKMVRYHFKDRYQNTATVLQVIKGAIAQGQSSRERSSPSATPSAIRGEGLFYPKDEFCPNDAHVQNGSKESNFSINPAACRSLLCPPTPEISPTAPEIAPPTSPAPEIASSTPPAPSIREVRAEETTSRTSRYSLLPLYAKFERRRPHLGLRATPSAMPAAHHGYHLRVWAAISAVLLGVVAGYAIYWQPRASVSTTLEPIETLIAEGKYKECVNQATTIPQNSPFYTDAQALLHECKLAEAMKFAADGNFPTAITEAAKIPQNSAYHQDAQQLVAQWSSSILGTATKQYQSGQLNDAIATAKSLPEISPVYQKSQEAIKQWNQDWERNNSYLKVAQNALNEGKWQKAINVAKQVIYTPYWQEKTEPIIQKAESKIAASKTAVTSKPKPSLKRAATRITPKVATRALKRAATHTTPRRAKRSVVKRFTRSVARRPTRTIPKRLPPSLTTRPRRSFPPQPPYTWTTETLP